MDFSHENSNDDGELLTAKIKAGCMEMCPAEEREFREDNFLLDKFESIDGPQVERRLRKTSPSMAVKVYSRSAAGAAYTSKSIRPPRVLQVRFS